MVNVVRLAPLAPEAGSGPRLHGGVRSYSRLLAWAFLALAGVFALLAAAAMGAMFLYRGPVLGIGSQGMLLEFGRRGLPAGYVPLGSLSLPNRLAYAVVAVARSGPKLGVLLNQAALFRLYGRGVVFDRANARRIRDTGLWLVLDGVSPFVCHLALSAGGFEVDHRWAHLGSLQEVVLGALVFVIAEVMQVGREIEEEQSQFV